LRFCRLCEDDVAAEQQAEQQAEREYRQEQERERSRRAGFPAWQVRVEVPSHRDVVALAGHLAAQGWRVRRRRRHLLVGADCEDDVKGLVRELSGDGRADADTAFGSGGSAIATCCLTPTPRRSPAVGHR
jgi:hypothetical protein